MAINVISSQRVRRGFTLTELMVAIGVLVLVILATGKIFGTASQVTGIGQATANVLQEAAAFERQLREDIQNLSTEGFFAVRNVAVPNNYNILNGNGGALLDPRLPADGIVRTDQLVFFRSGTATSQMYADGDPYADRSQISFFSRVYYGHSYQVPELAPEQLPRDSGFQNTDSDSPDWHRGVHLPWYEGSVLWFRQVPFGSGAAQHAQIPAAQWLLGRQSVLLANDGGSAESYNASGENSVEWLRDEDIRRNRRDIAARAMRDVRQDIENQGDWDAQRDFIEQRYIHYPRGERVAPDQVREMFSLTTGTIAAACSSFKVEWTYANDIGRVPNPAVGGFGGGCPFFHGAVAPSWAFEQPWFGLKGDRMSTLGDETMTFERWQDIAETEFSLDPTCRAVLPGVVERLWNLNIPSGPAEPERTVALTSIFGWNRVEALNDAVDPIAPTADMIYTPWPTAIRVTMVLHDTDGRLENGKEFQFVIDLPARAE